MERYLRLNGSEKILAVINILILINLNGLQAHRSIRHHISVSLLIKYVGCLEPEALE